MSLPEQGSADCPSETAGQARDLIDALAWQRSLLLATLKGISDDQARLRSTVSELTLGGLVKHVSATERGWQDFARGHEPDDQIDWNGIDWENPSPEALAKLRTRDLEFTLLPEETVEQVVADYERVAQQTADLLRSADLDAAYRLPPAPWFEGEPSWTVRRVALHILAETAQHAGHADLIREAIDGAKTMG